eukprot:gene2570-2872_t
MAKSLAIVLAFAALVGAAHATYWAGHGGFDCSGRITAIRCEEDPNGMLVGISYYNDEVGDFTSYCGSSHGYGYTPAPPGSITTRDWDLEIGDAIVSVEACRGGKYGYTTVTFWTDGGDSFTCGSGSYDYAPQDYASYGQQYQSYGYGADEGGYGGKGKKGRALLDADAGADIDTYMKKGSGWGWKSKCQVYDSPKQPVWNPRTGGKPGHIGGKDDWFKGGYDSGNWGYSQNKFGKSKAWKSYGSYYNYAGEDGKYTRYYKDYNTYKEQSADYASNPGSYNYKPGYYYKELYPLAGFGAKCDKNGYVYNLYGWCWNHNNVLPPRVDAVILNMEIILDPSLPCPPSEAAFLEAIANVTSGLELINCVGRVTVDPKSYACVPGGATGNTTITAQLYLYADESDDTCDLQAISNALVKAGILGQNLCASPLGAAQCDAANTQSLILTEKYSVKKMQQTLLTRAGRTSARRSTVLNTRRRGGRRN